MSWTPMGVGFLAKNYDGYTMVHIIQSLARELERMQRELDELKKKVSGDE